MLNTEKFRKGLAAALTLFLLAPSSQGLFAQSMSVVDLNMTVGKSLVIDYPVEIGRISTSSPDVVDAVPATAKEFLLHGKGHGAATVVVWAKNGARTMYNVTVEHNVDPIRKLLSETFPSEEIRIQSGRDSISLVGRVSSKEVADRAVAIATPMAKTVVSNLSVAAAPIEKQIMLKVRFAELNRNRGQQFGVNLISTGAANTPGRVTTGQFPAPIATAVNGQIGGTAEGTNTTFTLSDALNIFAFRPDLNLGAVIRALQNEDVLQILAEPNLVTLNGKEASFLVGGEFPVPVLQGGANAGAVTVQFREFGIRLTFNPQITGNGTIRMYVKPEVSTIDLANAVQLSGFTIPALATRRMETNVELKEGQSFVVAGLIDDRVTDQLSKIPGLASIPILGALFKTRLERKSKSELVVIVTPEIVEPINPGQKVPGPEFPREFMPSDAMMKNSKRTAPAADPSGTKDAAAVKNAENGAWKHVMFWRQGKKSGQVAIEPKTSHMGAEAALPPSLPPSPPSTSDAVSPVAPARTEPAAPAAAVSAEPSLPAVINPTTEPAPSTSVPLSPVSGPVPPTLPLQAQPIPSPTAAGTASASGRHSTGEGALAPGEESNATSPVKVLTGGSSVSEAPEATEASAASVSPSGTAAKVDDKNQSAVPEGEAAALESDKPAPRWVSPVPTPASTPATVTPKIAELARARRESNLSAIPGAVSGQLQ